MNLFAALRDIKGYVFHKSSIQEIDLETHLTEIAKRYSVPKEKIVFYFETMEKWKNELNEQGDLYSKRRFWTPSELVILTRYVEDTKFSKSKSDSLTEIAEIIDRTPSSAHFHYYSNQQTSDTNGDESVSIITTEETKDVVKNNTQILNETNNEDKSILEKIYLDKPKNSSGLFQTLGSLVSNLNDINNQSNHVEPFLRGLAEIASLATQSNKQVQKLKEKLLDKEQQIEKLTAKIEMYEKEHYHIRQLIEDFKTLKVSEQLTHFEEHQKQLSQILHTN